VTRLTLATKTVITAEIARALADVARHEIAVHRFSMYVAFVDEAGTPVLVERVCDGQSASFEIALAKARAAAGFRRATRAFEDRILKDGRLNLLSLPGILAVEGGLPLLVAGQVVGAVGVSGGTGAEDGQIAAAVASALLDMTGNSVISAPGADTAADRPTSPSHSS
jgi:glc operon protein GlcG